jgi:transcriptional regulator with XRE-family HTH domain
MANTQGTLGEVLRGARNNADLSLRDLAKKLSVTASYLSDIENDRRVPSEEVLGELAKVFNLKLDDLMALAGRVGDDGERYLKSHPSAGVLFRRLTDQRMPEEDLQKVVKYVDGLRKKKG